MYGVTPTHSGVTSFGETCHLGTTPNDEVFILVSRPNELVTSDTRPDGWPPNMISGDEWTYESVEAFNAELAVGALADDEFTTPTGATL